VNVRAELLGEPAARMSVYKERGTAIVRPRSCPLPAPRSVPRNDVRCANNRRLSALPATLFRRESREFGRPAPDSPRKLVKRVCREGGGRPEEPED